MLCQYVIVLLSFFKSFLGHLYDLALLAVFSVVWKEEVRHCWPIIHCIKSSFTCIWSCIFDDVKIFDKVRILSPSFILLWCARFIAVVLNLVFLLHPHSIHKGFCFRQGISSPISDLPERLLLEERDPPATPQETLYEAPPFDEVRIP